MSNSPRNAAKTVEPNGTVRGDIINEAIERKQDTGGAFNIVDVQGEGGHGEGSIWDLAKSYLTTETLYIASYRVRLRLRTLLYQARHTDWRALGITLMESSLCDYYSWCNLFTGILGMFSLPVFILSSQRDVGGVQRLPPQVKTRGLHAMMLLLFVHILTVCVTAFIIIRKHYLEKKQVRSPVHQLLYDLKKLRHRRLNAGTPQAHHVPLNQDSRTVEAALAALNAGNPDYALTVVYGHDSDATDTTQATVMPTNPPNSNCETDTRMRDQNNDPAESPHLGLMTEYGQELHDLHFDPQDIPPLQ